MNAERLLAHYERIADAPDAVARLRKFVLDLAVRGKLVPQDPSEEPASELMRRIQAEKKARNRPIRLGTASIEKRLPPGWEVVTLADFALDVSTGPFGSALHQSDYMVGGVPLVNPSHMIGDRIVADERVSVSKEIANKLSSYALRAGDVVMARRGEVGRAALVEIHQNGWLCGTGSFVVRFTDEVDRSFFLLLLRTTDLRRYLAGKAVGSTMINLNHNILKGAELPIPPLAEQKRIVAKVDELMALCDRLETSRSERESKRDRLTAATLARINAPDSDSEIFAKNARFALDNVSAIAARPDQIKQIRQTILNLAVRGKLVPQDLREEPASELLKRIATDREKLAALDRVVRRRQEGILLANGSIEAMSLPNTWTWARFQEIAKVLSNLVDPLSFKSYPHIAPDNIEGGTGKLLPYETIGASGVFSAKHLFKAGCLLYSKIRPALAKVTVAEFDGLCSADMYPIHAFIDRGYLQIYMLAEVFVRQSVSEDNRVAMPKINQESLAKILVAVPPLSEQHRITAKVGELMALCDRLEASLVAATVTSGELLAVLLSESLMATAERDKAA